MDDVFASVDGFVRHRKELANGDTDPLLIVIRGGRLIALVESNDVSQLLAQAELAASGYSADFLALTFEGVVPAAEVNPVTGQPWQRGEADAVRLQHNGLAKGWVEEIVVVAIVGRAGASRTTTYSITAADDGLSWDSERFGHRPVGVESHLQQALMAAARCGRGTGSGCRIRGVRRCAVPDTGGWPIDFGHRMHSHHRSPARTRGSGNDGS